MIRYLITLLKQIMEARVARLNLLMQEAERKLDMEKCCDTIRCSLDMKQKSSSKRGLDYYFHK
ncbi:hypothetical protein WJR50_33345 [Catalinimonas sp. 4WD22]|uniref:hypothetical protein n=1 Tax=Catalinimonas locisalis TaxID=3133978 RepID=UPI0031013726